MKRISLERRFRDIRKEVDELKYQSRVCKQMIDHLMATKKHIPFVEGHEARLRKQLLEQKEAEIKELLGL